MRNTIKLILIISVLSLFVIGCSHNKISAPKPAVEQQVVEKVGDTKGVSAGGENANVIIKGFKFTPKDLKVKVGTTVTWKNEDSAAHTVESNDGSFVSDELSQGDTFTFTFSNKGKFDYICGIHPSMTGSVTVE